MKKFDKKNFKRLALMGIAGGTAIVSQGAVEATDLNPSDLNPSDLLAYGGCHGKGGCGGLQAYRNTPSQGSYYYNQNPGNQPQSSCNAYYPAQQQTYYQPQGSCNTYQYQPQASYQYQPQASYQYQPQAAYQPQSSCSGYNAYNGYGYAQAQTQTQPQQPSGSCSNPHGCHGSTQPTPGSTTPDTQQDATPAQSSEGPVVTRWETSGYTAEAPKATLDRTLSESDLLSQLNEQGKASYQRLDAAGKALALKLANQSCKGLNDCKGLNSCKNNEHSCAGKGSCAGTADSNFKDKNLAVKVAAIKMAEKRTNATPQR